MWEKVEKMFLALHKVDMHMCYAKQKINMAYPKEVFSNTICCIKQLKNVKHKMSFSKLKYIFKKFL